jgi:molybdopterin-dependent oxidoreductase alpha subunit
VRLSKATTRCAAPPEKLRALTTAAPPNSAGGAGAFRATMAHMIEETGLIRGARALLAVNQVDGFDCPGCAWPDPAQRTTFEFCENGAKAVVHEATKKRVTPAFFAENSVRELLTWSDRDLNAAGRLTEPMLLDEEGTHYTPVSWDDAFALLADELDGLASPDEAVFYTSGRTSNEAAFLYQLLVRTFGTNNLPDCSNMCHESSGIGLTETIGIGKGTVTLEDFAHADLIIVIGQNPGTNHPRMLTTLQEASRRGAHIVSINPLREAGMSAFKHPQEPAGMLGIETPLARTFLQVKVNGDVALLNGVMKAMLEIDDTSARSRLAQGFISSRTSGFDELQAHLESLEWSPLCAASGLPEDEMRAFAETCLYSDATIICWAMGLTQHENGVANVQSVVNLLLLGGHFGRPGAGACPVRGHSNVQGDRTVGIWERPPEAFLDALEQRFDFSPPREHGVDVAAAIEAMHAGEAKVFFAMGGNFLSASPDTMYTAEALERCRLTASVATKLNRGHLVTGQRALILPCLGRTERDLQAGGEQFVTVENSMGFVHASRGGFAPAADSLLSETAIVARLAEALGVAPQVGWTAMAADYALIRDAIADCIPGFEGYNARLRKGGFYLPNGPREGHFTTDDGLAHFTVHDAPVWELHDDELLMMTIRSHDQYNTTIYSEDDRYRGVFGERRVVFMNADDMESRGLSPGDVVDLSSSFGGRRREANTFVVVPYELPAGCCATYFPEANPLVPVDQLAKGSRTPASKSVRIRVCSKSVGVSKA